MDYIYCTVCIKRTTKRQSINHEIISFTRFIHGSEAWRPIGSQIGTGQRDDQPLFVRLQQIGKVIVEDFGGDGGGGG